MLLMCVLLARCMFNNSLLNRGGVAVLVLEVSCNVFSFSNISKRLLFPCEHCFFQSLFRVCSVPFLEVLFMFFASGSLWGSQEGEFGSIAVKVLFFDEIRHVHKISTRFGTSGTILFGVTLYLFFKRCFTRTTMFRTFLFLVCFLDDVGEHLKNTNCICMGTHFSTCCFRFRLFYY